MLVIRSMASLITKGTAPLSIWPPLQRMARVQFIEKALRLSDPLSWISSRILLSRISISLSPLRKRVRVRRLPDLITPFNHVTYLTYLTSPHAPLPGHQVQLFRRAPSQFAPWPAWRARRPPAPLWSRAEIPHCDLPFRTWRARSGIPRPRLPRLCGSKNPFARRLGAPCRGRGQRQAQAPLPSRSGLFAPAPQSGHQVPVRHCGSAPARRTRPRSAASSKHIYALAPISLRRLTASQAGSAGILPAAAWPVRRRRSRV